ncbi:hypothetical protein BDD12DRAFT_810031 [Trichophaea hybrida]|nr:hypothetical protein BDD12DRAFT_810031 [Trichophaea hybrida]
MTSQSNNCFKWTYEQEDTLLQYMLYEISNDKSWKTCHKKTFHTDTAEKLQEKYGLPVIFQFWTNYKVFPDLSQKEGFQLNQNVQMIVASNEKWENDLNSRKRQKEDAQEGFIIYAYRIPALQPTPNVQFVQMDSAAQEDSQLQWYSPVGFPTNYGVLPESPWMYAYGGNNYMSGGPVEHSWHLRGL